MSPHPPSCPRPRSMETASELSVPADPALGVVVRGFVGGVGAHGDLSADLIADLQLAATELLASAVDARSERLQLSFVQSEDGWTLTASGIGDLRGSPRELSFPRIDLLTGLFSDIETGDSSVRLRGETSETS